MLLTKLKYYLACIVVVSVLTILNVYYNVTYNGFKHGYVKT